MMPAAMGTRPPVSIQLESLLAPLAPIEELFFWRGVDRVNLEWQLVAVK
jgi:hypothetical protein